MTDTCFALPLTLYDEIFQKYGDKAQQQFRDLLSEAISTKTDKIPILNETSLDLIPDGHIVCVYGMVQDMFGIELFMDEFSLSGSGDNRVHSFRFRDFSSDEVYSSEPENVKFGERQSAYVVPVPGESSWVRRTRASKCKYTPAVQLIGNKRAIGDDEELPIEPKKAKGTSADTSTSKPKPRKQFPLTEEEEEESRTGVLVRLYGEEQDTLKINEVVEVFGILEHTRLGSIMVQDEFAQDAKGSEPIPRVHAVIIRRLKHNNPCLPNSELMPAIDSHPDADKSSCLLSFVDQSRMNAARSTLHTILMECYKGDSLAADYTLIHLSSARLDVESPYPSKLPALNIVCPTNDEDTIHPSSPEVRVTLADTAGLLSRLRLLLPCLVTQLAPVTVTLESLNNGPNLMPIRDADRGSLDAGRLQLPNGTQVLVDETGMTTGQLQSRGVLNLRALTMLATKQCVPYDFQFYTQDWDTDCRVLIISAGQSLVKSTLALPWVPEGDFSVECTYNQADTAWNELRNYLTILTQSSSLYSMEEPLQKRINDDFVKWRRSKETFIEADDLAIMLCLLRTLCLTHGENHATVERWEQVCRMEEQRRLRLKKR
ncbi:hypothetical protein CRM22_008849 [Opisthorchis felineus]|uniref:Mini-chromosome maintenance complex-binding protein n=1 Tax=Opisthorchis felineus TaxID=147828 RepID=A0A4S2LHH4_OPIFE|nr:hypothetical protein CRM22_008849 [Opisthorchis felineus]